MRSPSAPQRFPLTYLLCCLTMMLGAPAARGGVTQELSVSDAAIVEGDSGAVNLAFTVTLDLAQGLPASVDFMTMDGTATAAGGDYQTSMGTVVFSTTPIPQTILVPVFGDINVEPDEMFQVILFNPIDALLADPIGDGTIINDDTGPPVLSIGDVSVTEGDSGQTMAVFTATLSNPPTVGVTAGFTTVDGTATAGSGDYQTTSGLLTIGPGMTMGTISVPVQGDTLVEADETFFVDLSNPTNATLGDGQGQGTILNDDAALPILSIADVSLVEGDDQSSAAVFTATLSAPANNLVTADFATQDGTATAGSGDYLGATGMLSIPAGAMSGTVTVTVQGDTEVEPDETFFLNLSNAVNAVLGDPQGQGTIFNDDLTLPSVSVGDAAVLEGDSDLRQIQFTATLSEPSPINITVNYSTQDGTATVADGDYLQSSGVLTFIEGSDSARFNVAVAGDTQSEPDEAFFVNLSAPDGAVLGDAQGRGTIRNDDDEPVLPEISVGDVAVVEGDQGVEVAAFAVTLSSPSEEPVRVDFATVDGSATVEDQDYRANSGQLVFEAGQTALTIPVEVLGDTALEEDETFVLRLSEPAGGTLGRNDGTATIRNDDQAPVLPAVTIGDVIVEEGDRGVVQAVFSVGLAPAAETPVMVSFATRDGSATLGDGDFRSATGTLTFNPGETNATIVVEVVGDTRPEIDEVFFIDLSNPVGAILEDGEGRGRISNDDQGVLSIGDVVVLEGDSGETDAVFRLSLSEASAVPVSLSFTTRDGTARAGSDYRATSGELSFRPGETEQTIAVAVLGDRRQERDETFFVDLSDFANAAAADSVGEGLIRNDDTVTGSVRFVPRSAVLEGEGPAVFEVERVDAGNNAASVRVQTLEGSARAGQDFSVVSTTLNWGAGESGIRRFEVPITNDDVLEADETFSLQLGQPVGTALGEPNQIEVRLLDDEAPLEVESPDGFSLSATVGERLDLEVRLTRGNGGPVAGAPVAWSIEGDGELLDEQLSTTDGEGVSRQRVNLGGMAGVVVVTARLGQSDRFVSFEIRVQGNLSTLVDPAANPGEAAVADALDRACVDASGEFRRLCDYVLSLGDAGDQRTVVGELTPEEVAAQGTLGLNSGRVQLRNVAERIQTLRSGGGQRGVGSLAASLRGETLTVSSLGRSTWQSYRSPYEIAALLLSDLDDALGDDEVSQGGTQSGDPGSGPDAREESNPGTSRFGFFINGRVSFGDRPTTEQEAGFDFDTQGLTVGVDYRLRDNFFFGGALGYLSTDSSIASDGGGLDTRGYSLLGYASYYGERFYLDATLGYGRNEYEFFRNIDLPQPFEGQSRIVAEGDPDGDQLSLGLRAGYQWQRGPWSLQGFGDLSSVDADIDSFAERGGGPFNLTFGEQSTESLLGEAGFEAAYVSSFSKGVLRPLIRFSYLHEFEDDARLIRARFSQDRSAVEFALPTSEPDRDYFNLTAGISATLVRGRTVYLTYDQDLGREDLDNQTIAVGLRMEF